jgi:hypothetical protein
MPENYLKILPKFNGDNGVIAKDHIAAFQDCTDNFAIEHDGISISMFHHSFEGDARQWFRSLPVDSIDS